ncbi:MAG: type III-A CRISPR-associated protein Cas10/Csm1 [Candidatus Omnitrophica bacterium]|nr:type III-A CRISPR-associated protein Cas10/Csm1 [Candidatus Omnitrophota bacterium]
MVYQSRHRSAIILGALLHDIGKFVQRASDNPRQYKHTSWGQKWFEEKLAEKLTPIFGDLIHQISSKIGCHHDGEKYISLADNLSAGMDRIALEKEEKGDPFSARLISIFSKISLSPHPKQTKYHSLAVLGEQNLQETFPIDEEKCTCLQYSSILEKFEKELQELDFRNLSFLSVINQIYFLLWKYTWCIPSAAYEDDPDVSLFDHLRTTAAITTCLYDYQQDNPTEILDLNTEAFQLIAADISGIQNYIFEVLTQEGKVAKRLRARSLYVQLISEIAAHKIIHNFNLGICNILSLAGGNFYVLVPNLRDTPQKIEKIEKEFAEWSYRNFKAEMTITIERISFGGIQFFRYNDLLGSLKQNMQIKKYRPFSSILTTENKWKDNFLLEEILVDDERICQSCHKHAAVTENKEKEKLCSFCYNDEKLGEEIPKANFIAFFDNQENGYPILGYSFRLLTDYSEASSAYLIYALNDTSFTKLGIGFKFLTNHIPTFGKIKCNISEHHHSESQPLFFECLGALAKGDGVIGYFKADVDNLGKILKEGFRRPSISRYVFFSNMLEIFFSGYLQKTLEKDFSDIYTLFSGGDDLFVVGPWNRVIELGVELRKSFRKFTADNLDFTFSAGIHFAKPHEPVSYCAEYVKKEINRSKNRTGKDAITFWGRSLSWCQLEALLTEAQQVIHWLEKEPPILSRRFVYNLKKFSQMAEQYKKTHDARYLQFVPLLNYDIYRNLSGEEKKEIREWAINFSPTFEKPKQDKSVDFLNNLVEYVLVSTRRKINERFTE